ncbi:VOC family protein [Allorhizobium sp. BGMRC 0089]|uniref:VOC family protein n=1 Tax=Allorhizobium sonneratiae TaxID=2934936 RepID=UPI002034290A|nr:VOC family protein [Allorhizobium sonneratiae]MCM2293746.1 VOC family protein [Allorhizobium sonneratiae]
MSHSASRSVDHFVLPVTMLDGAVTRFQMLGFTVAPPADHPFGTQNACVFLSDKTYLEPLAVGRQAEADRAVLDGNVFVTRDRAFRTERKEGLSAIVAASDDAEADHIGFVEKGMSGGSLLDFSRPMRLPDGGEAMASFRLAFATEANESGFFLFTCQRIAPLSADRSQLETHANGVTGISRIFLHARHPNRYRNWFETVFAVSAAETSGGLLFEAKNLAIEIIEASDLADILIATALVFSVKDIDVTGRVLTDNGIEHQKMPGGIAVAAAPGQGVALLFEESIS